MRRFSLAIMLAAGTFFSAVAQDFKLPALSPNAKISQDFSTSSIEISYSRPSMRNRRIFGDLVPYNEVWRTGANSATRIKFAENVWIGNQEVKAGEYALYTIPGKDQWEVILNKGTSNWGTAGYDKKDDVVRMGVRAAKLSTDVQTFTINISDITFSSCNIELMWEKTMISIPVKAKNEERLNASIDKAINQPTIPYYQAASYYYETNQNLDKAMEYVDKAIAMSPSAFYMYNLKAKIAQKQNDKETAVAAAKRSAELARGTAFEGEYKRNADKIIKAMK